MRIHGFVQRGRAMFSDDGRLTSTIGEDAGVLTTGQPPEPRAERTTHAITPGDKLLLFSGSRKATAISANGVMMY